MGRPSYEPSPDDKLKVVAMVQAAVSQEEMARQLGIAKKTLQKHFAFELGREETDGATGEKTGRRVKTPPSFAPSPEQREAVEILAASKIVSLEDIADRIGISVEALEHHFAEELRRGPAKRNTEVLIATQKLAAAGNVSAQRLWLVITGAASPKPGGAAKPQPALGKKDQANKTASAAIQDGGKFAPRAAPRLAVDNT
jgi:biotin operon repressor